MKRFNVVVHMEDAEGDLSPFMNDCIDLNSDPEDEDGPTAIATVDGWLIVRTVNGVQVLYNKDAIQYVEITEYEDVPT